MLPSAQFTFDMCAEAFLKTQKNQSSTVPSCTGYGRPRD